MKAGTAARYITQVLLDMPGTAARHAGILLFVQRLSPRAIPLPTADS